jgi:hypothetical protein
MPVPVCRTFLALLLCASAGWGADLRTLKDEVVKGDLVSITDKEIVLDQGGKKVATPVDQVLKLEFAPAGRLPPDTKFADVELTDGTLLHCSEYGIKGKDVEVKLLAGQTVKVPLAAVGNILNDAQVEKYRKEWTGRLAKHRLARKRNDVLARLVKDEENPEGVPNGIDGTLGEGDETGKEIEFTLTLGKEKISKKFPLASIHGLIFVRDPDPRAPPPPTVVCKLHDTYHNLVYVSGVASTPAGLTVTTPAGARIEYTKDLLAALDYSKGKLEWLSLASGGRGLVPVKLVQTHPFADYVEPPKSDKNLDNGPLRVGTGIYARGLAIHAYTELEYDFKGEFREFKAVAGIDEGVPGADGPILLRIEGDGKELFSKSFSRKDKQRAHQIALNIKDVQKLRIIVGSGGLEDIGKHLDLADAKVSK